MYATAFACGKFLVCEFFATATAKRTSQFEPGGIQARTSAIHPMLLEALSVSHLEITMVVYSVFN